MFAQTGCLSLGGMSIVSTVWRVFVVACICRHCMGLPIQSHEQNHHMHSSVFDRRQDGQQRIVARFSSTKQSVVEVRQEEAVSWFASSKTRFAADDIAIALYVHSSTTKSNFGTLEVVTNGAYSDEEQMWAAGYIEGYVSAHEIAQQYHNLHAYFVSTMGVDLEKPMEWIQEQDEWIREMCHSNSRRKKSDARFWSAVCLVLQQFDGLVQGYQALYSERPGRVPELQYHDFLFLESNADLYDVIDALDPSQRPRWNISATDPQKTPSQLLNELALEQSKCSALVTFSADLSELYMGHSTWDSYTAMLRIYKHYHFDLNFKPAGARMSFSSYPGELFSDDDFYLLSSRMVILQTTNKIFNGELFDKVLENNHVVLSWQRVRAANLIAESGKEWAKLFAKENSGTYNNQYMVIDLDSYQDQKVSSGLLTIVEQIPGLVMDEDATEVLLRAGYWPSYNIPYFKEVYEASGYPDFSDPSLRKDSDYYDTLLWLSYTSSPRANIFRRDHAAVDSVEGMQALMRQNNFKNDPLTKGNPVMAVCGRGDLNVQAPETRGCYDTKVTSSKMAAEYAAYAVNGPTTDGGLPPFSWSSDDHQIHQGHPSVFNFSFERMQPVNSGVLEE